MTLKKLTLFLAVHIIILLLGDCLATATPLFYGTRFLNKQFIFGSLSFFLFFLRLRFIYALFPISTDQLLQKQQNQTPKSFSEIHLPPISTNLYYLTCQWG